MACLVSMMVTNIFQSEVEFNLEDPEQWFVNDLRYEDVLKGLEKLRGWWNRKYFLSYSVGCWITSYARRHLFELLEAPGMDDRAVYCDTDSIFYLGHYDWSKYNEEADRKLWEACKYHGFDFERTRPMDPKGKKHPLGHFDMEPGFDNLKSLGAKKYCEERDGELYLTVSGINKEAVSCLHGNIDNFRNGFIFDKDENRITEDGKLEGTKKLEHTYLTDMRRIIYPDGFVSDLKYGINMRPTGYQLSIPTIYNSLENLMDFVINPNDDEIIRKRGIIHV